MSTSRYIYPDMPRVSGYIGIRAEHCRLPMMNHRELWSRIDRERGEETTEYTL
jgi:hypothetical protein